MADAPTMPFTDGINFFCSCFDSTVKHFIRIGNGENKSNHSSTHRFRSGGTIRRFLAEPELGTIYRKTYDHASAGIVMVIHLGCVESGLVKINSTDGNRNPGSKGVFDQGGFWTHRPNSLFGMRMLDKSITELYTSAFAACAGINT